jgi:DNA-binding CsgD family transcriptional regulator
MTKQAKVDTAKAILELRIKLFGRRANDRRGMNARNIVRILRKGRERRAAAKANPAVDLMVLPSDSKIRKATWESYGRAIGLLPPSMSQRGRAGRAAMTTRKEAKQARAIKLLSKGRTEVQVAKALGCTERTIRRYKTGR